MQPANWHCSQQIVNAASKLALQPANWRCSQQIGIAAMSQSINWQGHCLHHDIGNFCVLSPDAALAPLFICLALPACEVSTGTPMLATISLVLQ